MIQNEPLPGNDIAMSKRELTKILDDVVNDAISAQGLLEVFAQYVSGNDALMSRDPWNAGFWETLEAAQTRLHMATDGAETALAAACK